MSKKEGKAAAKVLVLLGSGVLPAMVNIAEGKDVQLGDVVAEAHKASGLSVEEWNELPESERDEKLNAAIEAMRAAESAPGAEKENATGARVLGAVIDQESEPPGGWCYPVLTPFKLGEAVIKEGFIQLTAEEAEPHLQAKVIGDDVCFPPGYGPSAE